MLPDGQRRDLEPDATLAISVTTILLDDAGEAAIVIPPSDSGG